MKLEGQRASEREAQNPAGPVSEGGLPAILISSILTRINREVKSVPRFSKNAFPHAASCCDTYYTASSATGDFNKRKDQDIIRLVKILNTKRCRLSVFLY